MSGAPRASQWFDESAAPARLVRGATLVRLHAIREARGHLAVAEIGRGLPFTPRRFFVISEVPSGDIRGQHAHRELHQFLVCLAGSVSVDVDDGTERATTVLDTPGVGLHLEPMVWASQHRYSADAVLLVMASAEYDAADYIREYALYLEECARR